MDAISAPSPSADQLLQQYVSAIIAEEEYAVERLHKEGLATLRSPAFAKLMARHLSGAHADAYGTAYAVARALEDAFSGTLDRSSRVSFMSVATVAVTLYAEPSILSAHKRVLVEALKALTKTGILQVYISTQESSALIVPTSDRWITDIF